MISLNKNKLLEDKTDSEPDGVYRSPAHSDDEKVAVKLSKSSNLADILSREPLDEFDVSRRALIGIVTKNVLDADIADETW